MKEKDRVEELCDTGGGALNLFNGLKCQKEFQVNLE